MNADDWIMYAKAPGNTWGLMYGVINAEEHINLFGFDSPFDAWAFLFAHLSIDVSKFTANNKWTLKPPTLEPEQLTLF